VDRSSRSGQVVTELLRLGVVLLLTAGGYALGEVVDGWFELGETETTRLLTSVLGALFGYLLGGALGRAIVRGVDTATVRLERCPPPSSSRPASVPPVVRSSVWRSCCPSCSCPTSATRSRSRC
jgi:hypothetical protein